MPRQYHNDDEKAILRARRPIKERLEQAFADTPSMRYVKLAYLVFPPEEYRRSWQHASQGGPPGCYMALTRACKRYGYRIDYGAGVVYRA